MNKRKKTNKAFSLVECVIAVGVVSVSLVPMIGLLPVGLTGASSSSTQTSASNIATAIAADLRTAEGASSPRFAINLGSTADQTVYLDEAGAPSATLAPSSRYKALVKLVPVSSTMNMGRVTITWPAQAAAANVTGSVDAVVPVAKQ
jgi:uncharacterized protein (TIGR02598 family)